MKTKFNLLLLTLFTLITTVSLAQSTNPVEQTFHESGKINVVIAIICVIFIGIIVYMVKLDRKISRLEKEEMGK